MALKPLNSVGGFSVGEIPANVILANSDIFTNNFTVNSFANLGNVGNVYIGGGNNGAVLSTDGLGNLTWSSSPGVTEIQNGNSNVSIPTASGNIYINANASTDQQWVFDTTGVLTTPGNIGLGGHSIVDINGQGIELFSNSYAQLNYNNSSYVYVQSDGVWLDTNSGSLHLDNAGNVIITGNLEVQGNIANVNNISITNNLDGNTANFSGNIVSLNANLGNLATANNFATNGTGGDITLTGGNIKGANVVLANSFTSNGGLVDFSTNNANVQLGDVSNVHIYGGSNGQVLQTDGTGNLTWSSTANISEIHNGNSNVEIPVSNGNVYINANAGTDYQWNFDTTGNLNIPQGGYVASGNAALELSDTSSVWLTPNVNADLTGLYMVNNGSAQLYAYSNVSIYSNEAGPQYEWNFNNNGNLVLPNNSVGYATITAQAANNISIQTGGATYSQVILNDNSDILLYTNAQYYSYQFGADGTFLVGSGQTIDFNTNSANVQLGSNANVHLYGGNVGEVLQTDGAGNLNWYAISATGIQNGNSNVSIPVANGNIYINANAGTDYQWNFDTTGNLKLPGTLFFSDNSSNIQLNASESNALQIYGDTGLHLDSGFGSNVLVKPGLNGNFNITSTNSSNSWVFDYNDNLTAPGNATANLGNLVTANYANFNNDLNVLGGNANITGNLSAQYGNFANDLEVMGNIQTGGGAGGNISGVDYLFADYANITYDLTVNNNVYVQGNVTSNYFYANIDANIAGNLTVQTNANINGNLTVGNISGVFANGTSNVAIPSVNGNVIISVNGTANVLTVSDTNVVTSGNTITRGNVISNATFIGNTITSVGTYLTIASDQVSNSSYNINLVPGGAGNVDVNTRYITSVADPINPQDAATKQYVDSVSQGLYIHPAANLLSGTNLNATYTIGGITLTVTDIIGNNTIQFSTAHGLSVDNDVTFTNSFNGLNGSPDVYYVDTIPAPNQITLKSTYYGPIVNTLTPGTGLSEPSIGQAGVGATLTNAGANAALVVDSISTTVGERILVTGQADQAQNGIYDVTTVGDGSTPWVLTRSSDGNSYIPQSSTALCSGSYFFIQNGNIYGGSSWVLSTTGEINIGVTNITFTQFSTGGAYTGTNGILVTGTQISANVDNVTTAIIGGNIAVKTGANLVTPNIGDATFSSLSWNSLSNGNINVSNVNSSNTVLTNVLSVNTSATVNSFVSNTTANITTDLTVGGNTYLANSTGTQVVVGTGSGGNISGVNYLFANVANLGDAYLTGNITATTGNITANGLYGNSLAINNGGPANITGNLTANYIFANVNANIGGDINVTSTGNLTFNGGAIFNGVLGTKLATQGFSIVGGSYDGSSLTIGAAAGGQGWYGNSIRGANIIFNTGATGTVTSTWDLNNDGNTSFPTLGTVNLGNIAIANTANISNNIVLGNTQLNWSTVTTIGIAANQTIAEAPVSGITGIEFLIKGVDSLGTKYSVATVQAVTDGSNVDYSVYGGVNLNGTTGSLAVNIANGNIQLQVTPSSSNSTVWTTQYRLI